jgi:hypothetical protein
MNDPQLWWNDHEAGRGGVYRLVKMRDGTIQDYDHFVYLCHVVRRLTHVNLAELRVLMTMFLGFPEEAVLVACQEGDLLYADDEKWGEPPWELASEAIDEPIDLWNLPFLPPPEWGTPPWQCPSPEDAP